MEPSAARAVLRDVFGHADYRGGQREAVEAVLAGRDAVVLLPTGAGKSLCYQVPAVALARAGQGTTIVISPLIALMDDQVGALAGRGIVAAAIHSHQEDDERREVITRFARGELELLYVSPERAALASFRQLAARVRVAMLAIDEAHCVSQWGHDFRPEYMELHELRRIVRAPTIALTATATPRVMTEIASALELAEPVRVSGDFRRPNLSFEVRRLPKDAERIAATIATLDEAGLRGRGTGRAIVYCATRKKTELVAGELKSAGFAVGHYHAGRTALARERSQRAFATARTRVLVATSAFGMGIDYPDVRVIVHFQAPGSLEAYYQEAGRAGRDGEPGRCVLLFGASDLVTQRRLMERGRGSVAAQTRAEDALAAIEAYVHTATCRQVQLCAHFEPAGEHARCARCDVCTGVVAEELHAPVELRASPRPAKPRMLTPRAERKAGRRPPWLAKNAEGRAERQRDRRPRTNSVTLELDTYRKRMARQLKWKAYMVFQQKTIAAIAEQRPLSRDALLRIPGLGPAKIARFGDDIIAVVRRHSPSE